MPQQQSEINRLLIVVAILAVVGGLSIVILTSPQSWELGPMAWFQGQPPTATASVPAPTEPPTATATPEPPTATVTVRPSATATVPPSATATDAPPTDTATAEPTATATEIVLPPEAAALARVTLNGAANGRVRNAPNGDTVIAVLPEGTEVYMLFNQVTIDGVVWVEIEVVNDTVTGWMADFLLEIVYPR